MRYLKTFEQVEDFYISTYSKYLIVTKDEKYVVHNRTQGLKDARLYPLDNIGGADIDQFLITYPNDLLKQLNEYGSEEKAKSKYSQKGMYSGMILKHILDRDGFILTFDEPYNKDNMYKIVKYNVGYQKDTPLNI